MNEVSNLLENNKELEKKYLIFVLKEQKYAFSIKNIKEIITKPKINPAPNLPDYYLGMTKLRNEIVPIISLRKKLNYPTIEQENKDLIEMLKLREQDHINWLNELESCVNENREFKLQRDPRLCNFGRWYYSFKTDSYALYSLLQKFEEPHNQIHAIAYKVLDTMKTEGKESALNILSHTRGFELKRMLNLFQELYKAIENNDRETTIVFYQKNGKQVGFVVDQIDRIIEIPKEDIDSVDQSNSFSEYLYGIGKVGDNFYLIFNEEKLI